VTGVGLEPLVLMPEEYTGFLKEAMRSMPRG
jgi:hypothetical protein